MHPTVVLNVVGLSTSLLGEHAPRLSALARDSALHRLEPVLPAVTCSVQSSMLTGAPPREHGIVGNGWYDRELADVQFWKQSNHLVHGEKLWDVARRRDPSFTCANMFWWYNMYSGADVSVTPRPIYCADGRKIPDVYSNPAGLRDDLQRELGRFPLFNFWGPASSIVSSRWIADAARIVFDRFAPTLSLVYLPHLDYGLQKLGPGDPAMAAELRAIDTLVGELVDEFRQRGARVIVLSEYGIEPVHAAIAVNRTLREHGHLAVREEQGGELLDAGASAAFAVADHQVAHVYVRDAAQTSAIATLLGGLDGVDAVLDRDGQREHGLDHARSGDLVLTAAAGHWFTYAYWLDDARAPDFARTVDIHRKPGYDPLELFLDPAITAVKARLAIKLLRKKLGFRTLMDVIPLDPSLVRGSHGRVDLPDELKPVLITDAAGPEAESFPCTGVRDVILRHVFD